MLYVAMIAIASKVPDPCLDMPCDVNAVCDREGLLSTNFNCMCVHPYTDGNGFECSSKISMLYVIYHSIIQISVPDPCLSDPCDVNADCTREGLQSPDFTCTCREPFIDGDGFSCSSIH